jgi:hypothetical protein
VVVHAQLADAVDALARVLGTRDLLDDKRRRLLSAAIAPCRLARFERGSSVNRHRTTLSTAAGLGSHSTPGGIEGLRVEPVVRDVLGQGVRIPVASVLGLRLVVLPIVVGWFRARSSVFWVARENVHLNR